MEASGCARQHNMLMGTNLPAENCESWISSQRDVMQNLMASADCETHIVFTRQAADDAAMRFPGDREF